MVDHALSLSFAVSTSNPVQRSTALPGFKPMPLHFAVSRSGLKISEHQALKWITMNPAWALGIEHQVGSIKVGKSADIAIWDRPPLSVYSKAVWVFIDGHERHGPKQTDTPWSDFEVKP